MLPLVAVILRDAKWGKKQKKKIIILFFLTKLNMNRNFVVCYMTILLFCKKNVIVNKLYEINIYFFNKDILLTKYDFFVLLKRVEMDNEWVRRSSVDPKLIEIPAFTDLSRRRGKLRDICHRRKRYSPQIRNCSF